MKTTETTEEVSSHRVEKRVERRNWRQIATFAREEPTGTRKKPCKSVEWEENHEKGPRWSWARNHMGNPSLCLIACESSAH